MAAKSDPPLRHPRPDPWKDRLAEWRKTYEQNGEKLRVDWMAAMERATKGDLDADRLAQEIVSLTRHVEEQTGKLDTWDREIVKEMQRRGLKLENPQ